MHKWVNMKVRKIIFQGPKTKIIKKLSKHEPTCSCLEQFASLSTQEFKVLSAM